MLLIFVLSIVGMFIFAMYWLFSLGTNNGMLSLYFIGFTISSLICILSGTYYFRKDFELSEAQIIQTNDLGRSGFGNVKIEGIVRIKQEKYVKKGFLINDTKYEYILILEEK